MYIGSEKLKTRGVNRAHLVFNVDGTLLSTLNLRHIFCYITILLGHNPTKTLRRLDFLVEVSVPCEPDVEG